MEQPSGDVTTFSYDNANNLLSEVRTGTKPYSGTYTYDMSNRRKTALVVTNGVTVHNGTYTYDGAGRLTQVVDAATSLTEVYTWNNDGTLASAPGSGYTKLFEYDEEHHLTRIQHNTGGTITTAFEYGYAADGGRRWRKDYTANVWTWYPCGVACNAGELVEQTSTLAGGTWTTSALYLKAGSGCSSQIIRRNGEYHHADILNNYTLISNTSGNLLSSRVYDYFANQRFSTGSAVTIWYSKNGFMEDGIAANAGMASYFLTTRDTNLLLDMSTFPLSSPISIAFPIGDFPIGIFQIGIPGTCSFVEQAYCFGWCKGRRAIPLGCFSRGGKVPKCYCIKLRDTIF